jgi:hypothetical protein
MITSLSESQGARSSYIRMIHRCNQFERAHGIKLFCIWITLFRGQIFQLQFASPAPGVRAVLSMPGIAQLNQRVVHVSWS